MDFIDGSLFPENQQKLVITAAPFGPEWMPSDFPEDIAVSMDAQIQKAVDCYNAGATVLHVHVREPDGTGSKRLSMFNELLAGLRKAVQGFTSASQFAQYHVLTKLAPALREVFASDEGEFAKLFSGYMTPPVNPASKAGAGVAQSPTGANHEGKQ